MEPVGRGQAGEHGVGLGQSGDGYDQALTGPEPSVDLIGRGLVALMPRTDGGDHAARVRQEARHDASLSRRPTTEGPSGLLHVLGGERRRGRDGPGGQQAASAHQPHRQRRRLDLDPPVPEANVQGHPGLQPRLSSNLPGNDNPPGRINGRFHGRDHTIPWPVI